MISVKIKSIGGFVLSFLENCTVSNFLLLWVFIATIFCNSIFTSGEDFSAVFSIVYATRKIIYIILFFLFLLNLIIFKKGKLFFSKHVVLIFLYLLTAFVSILSNSSHSEINQSIASIINLFFTSLIGFIFIQHFSFIEIKKIGYIFIAFGFLNILLFFFMSPLIKAESLFGDPNLFARFLNVCLAFQLTKYLTRVKKAIDIELIGILIIFACILFLYSRSGYILTLFTITTIILWIGWKSLKKVFIFLLPIILLLFSLMIYLRIVNSKMDVVNYSDLGRISVLKAGINMIAQNPLTGVGYGLSSIRFHEYENKHQVGAPDVTTIHNGYVAVFAEQGIFGLLVYLYLNFSILYELFRRANQEKESDRKAIFVFCFVSLAVFMIHILVYHPVDYEGVYWIIVAMCIVALTSQKPKLPVSYTFLRFPRM